MSPWLVALELAVIVVFARVAWWALGEDDDALPPFRHVFYAWFLIEAFLLAMWEWLTTDRPEVPAEEPAFPQWREDGLDDGDVFDFNFPGGTA